MIRVMKREKRTLRIEGGEVLVRNGGSKEERGLKKNRR